MTLGVAIIGCGNIAAHYVETLREHEEIALVGAFDTQLQRARAVAESFSGKAYRSLDGLLADGEVDIALNLTVPRAHAEITGLCLSAGKNVFSEKPLAANYAEAAGLVELAERRRLRLACAPATFLGEAQQTIWELVRKHRIGSVRMAYAEVNQGRIELWHPVPAPFYEVGPLADTGVYPLTLLTAMFGPARRVVAYGQTLAPHRVGLDGARFDVVVPDFVVALIELRDGPVVRLTTTFYVDRRSSKQDGLELHGDSGSLYLGGFLDFDGPVEAANGIGALSPVPLVGAPYRGVHWGKGVVELARAIMQSRPHRASGDHAAHVVEILDAATLSLTEGRPVDIRSDFAALAPGESPA